MGNAEYMGTCEDGREPMQVQFTRRSIMTSSMQMCFPIGDHEGLFDKHGRPFTSRGHIERCCDMGENWYKNLKHACPTAKDENRGVTEQEWNVLVTNAAKALQQKIKKLSKYEGVELKQFTTKIEIEKTMSESQQDFLTV